MGKAAAARATRDDDVSAQMRRMLERLEEQRHYVRAGAERNANVIEVAYGGEYASVGKDFAFSA